MRNEMVDHTDFKKLSSDWLAPLAHAIAAQKLPSQQCYGNSQIPTHPFEYDEVGAEKKLKALMNKHFINLLPIKNLHNQYFMKHLLIKMICIGVLHFLIGHDAIAQQKKYALIIGVKSYQYVAPLQNSLNDARDMAATLKSKGFTVVELYDPATKRIMQDGILKYFKLLQAQPDAAGLVFYSGHGMQVKGVNYLIPAQADPQIEADLDDQCVNMDYVMRAIEQAGNGLNIFVLDACRNNPFRSFSRSSEKGLSMVETPKGSYIVYATKPGSVASDGTGRNGLFTSKLLKYINTQGLNIEQVFKRTANDVAIASGDAQRPWIASDYTGDFFFTPGIIAPESENRTSIIVNENPDIENISLEYLFGNTKTLNADTSQYFSYRIINDKVIFYFYSSEFPSLDFDVNHNNVIDARVDRSYGTDGNENLCAQYLLTEDTSTTCGQATNSQLQVRGKLYKFSIPLFEISNSDFISFQVSFWNDPESKLTMFPVGVKHRDFHRSSMFNFSTR